MVTISAKSFSVEVRSPPGATLPNQIAHTPERIACDRGGERGFVARVGLVDSGIRCLEGALAEHMAHHLNGFIFSLHPGKGPLVPGGG